MPYDDLVKRLRELSSIPEHCETVDDCSQCSKEDLCLSFTNKRIIEVATQAANTIEELGRTQERWIPVTERLPKYGERVLVFGGFTMYVAYYDKNRYGAESWHKLNSKSHYCNPTHWMSLPDSPNCGTDMQISATNCKNTTTTGKDKEET